MAYCEEKGLVGFLIISTIREINKLSSAITGMVYFGKKTRFDLWTSARGKNTLLGKGN